MNVIDFLRESAKFLALDRPDLYTEETAMDELDRIMNQMRDIPGSGATSFTDYYLLRYTEEGLEEWDLVRKLSSVVSYDDEPGVWVCSFTHGSEALKHGINLPDVLDEIE
jgi:hypothetical protein